MSRQEYEPIFLKVAKQSLMEERWQKGGVICPCCEQRSKVYKRSINGSMVVGLKRMLKLGPNNYHHLYKSILAKGKFFVSGDVTKLRYWKLLEKKPESKEELEAKGMTSFGYWKLTKKGIDFLFNKIKVPKYAMVYDTSCLGFEGDLVSVLDCMGKKFSYSEIMAEISYPFSEQFSLDLEGVL